MVDDIELKRDNITFEVLSPSEISPLNMFDFSRILNFIFPSLEALCVDLFKGRGLPDFVYCFLFVLVGSGVKFEINRMANYYGLRDLIEILSYIHDNSEVTTDNARPTKVKSFLQVYAKLQYSQTTKIRSFNEIFTTKYIRPL